MPKTPDQADLPGTVEEVTTIVNLLPDAMPEHFLVNPTKAEVESPIQNCQIAHFTCHSEASPSVPLLRHNLILEDCRVDDFSVMPVLQFQLGHPQLAYLSACKTAVNMHPRCLDEGIHMAGAFQLAGFSQVIATLWQVGDASSVQVAEEVYRTMCLASSRPEAIDITAAARGLHRAVRKLRDKEGYENGVPVVLRKTPVVWAAYIHIGS